jgi:hypothetical protein
MWLVQNLQPGAAIIGRTGGKTSAARIAHCSLHHALDLLQFVADKSKLLRTFSCGLLDRTHSFWRAKLTGQNLLDNTFAECRPMCQACHLLRQCQGSGLSHQRQRSDLACLELELQVLSAAELLPWFHGLLQPHKPWQPFQNQACHAYQRSALSNQHILVPLPFNELRAELHQLAPRYLFAQVQLLALD